MKNAIIIFSGGQDSTTCLYWAKNRYDKIIAITFFYGQKHLIEIEQSKKICEKAGIEQKIIDINFLSYLTDSDLLTNNDITGNNKKGLPNSFVPNRNALFLLLAHSLAQKTDSDIITGFCQTDNSGFPDCRKIFSDDFMKIINYGSSSDIKLYTPLINLSKSEIFKLSKTEGCLDIIIRDTITCYNGVISMNEWGMGCGECLSCVGRKKGWEEFKG